MPTESELWKEQRPTAESSLSFAVDFLGCRTGDDNDEDLDANALARLVKIVRAVSLVESRHGTTGAHHPKEDPFQSGNPGDAWWKELTGQSGDGSRFIRKPGLTNLWARQVQAAAEQTAGFPTHAAFSELGDKKKGHTDAGFTPVHSYTWGIIYLIHKINTTAGDKTYQCADLARQRLIDGAVAYNGGGVADYEQRIKNALAEIGDIPAPLMAELELRTTSRERSFSRQLGDISAFIEASHTLPKFFPNGITKIHLEVKAKDIVLNLEISGPDRVGGGQQPSRPTFEQLSEPRETPGPSREKKLSGAAWVSEFADSQSTSDLKAPFGASVDRFIAAMEEAGASVAIGTTLRPLKRAYLMHYAWRIAKKEIKAGDVPAMTNVDIEWVHPSDAASIQAAADMVSGYNIVAKPALNSRHTEGRGIDMTISWSGTLTISKKDGTSVAITGTPRNGENTDLQSVGKGYGVIKATFAGDPPHWSDDGH
jgi:hypothetical protein